jgi:hypothetical protein
VVERADSTTEQIARAFQQLCNERKLTTIITKEGVAQAAEDQAIVDAASALTIDKIVKELADLQLAIDGTAQELANTLLAEATKLDQVRRAIEIETSHLQALAEIETASNALDVLVQEKEAELQALEAQSAQQEQAFDEEVAARRHDWQQEAQAHEQAVVAYQAALAKERSQEQADFQYELERKRKIELDEFNAQQREKNIEMAEAERAKLADWAERESAIAQQEQAAQAYRAQIEAFPAELEQAVTAARESAFQTTSQEAQIKTDLLRSEIAANQQVRDLNVQVLQEIINR